MNSDYALLGGRLQPVDLIETAPVQQVRLVVGPGTNLTRLSFEQECRVWLAHDRLATALASERERGSLRYDD